MARKLICLIAALSLGIMARSQVVTVQCDTSVCDSIVWRDTVYRFGASNPNYWTTVVLRDTLSQDTVVQWNCRIHTSTYWCDTAMACESFTWGNIAFRIPPGQHRIVVDTTLVSTNVAGCPSYRRLTLSLYGNDTTVVRDVACDQYHWDVTGEELFETDIYVCQYQNQAGCDSLLLLDLTVYCSSVEDFGDSICQGEVYHFYGRNLTTAGHYAQTFQSEVEPYCDSIIVLILTVLQPPEIHFSSSVDCAKRLHVVRAETPVDYVEWSAWPRDSDLDPQIHNRVILVNPLDNTTYTLFADYFPERTCPNTATITLPHIHSLEARMMLTPPQLSMETPSFELRDVTSNAIGRDWYVDGEWVSSSLTTTQVTPIAADSVHILLDAHNAYCHDSARLDLRVLRSNTFTPNAFTPGQSTNNLFLLPWTGIIDFQLSVFDRRGELVFSTNDINQGWDGRCQGRDCPAGTYVWLAQFTDEIRPTNPQVRKGTVALIR